MILDKVLHDGMSVEGFMFSIYMLTWVVKIETVSGGSRKQLISIAYVAPGLSTLCPI